MKTLKEDYYLDEEFYSIVKDILSHEEFLKTKEIKHHGINRYNHSLRVSYYTYKASKMLGFNYYEATRGALLHDFFLDETKDDSAIGALCNHPKYALENAVRHFSLTKREKNIIKSHMFPVSITLPRYKESWLVDIVDDLCSFYERFYSTREVVSKFALFILVFFFARLP